MTIFADGSIPFDGDLSKLLGNRGVGGASPATPTPLTAAGKLAADNEAARLAKYGQAGVDKMKAAGGTFGGGSRPAAAPSIGTETNAAPVATSQAANELTFGQKALRVLRGIGRGVGGAQVGMGVYDAAHGDMGNAADNVFNGAATMVHPAVGVAGNMLTQARDAVMGPIINAIYRNRTFPPQKDAPTGTAVPSPNPNVDTTSGERATPEVLMNTELGSKLVPVEGQGAFKRTTPGNEGVATKVSSAVGGVAAASGATAVAPRPVLTAPKLGTDGGIFGNMVNFANDVNQQKLNVAGENRDFNRGVKGATLANAGAKLDIEAENARSARIKALASMATAGQSGKKVTVGMMGEPIIVDTHKGTATAPTVNKPVTEADITETMKKNKLTRPQVLERLQQEGRLPQ